MQLTFLGTGTSYGVPYVGCHCAVCSSEDARNKRLRCSVIVEAGETRVLVDTTPDLRQQLLRAGAGTLSAVLWTHSHNDHVIGLDDIRPLTDRAGYIDGYANEATLAHLQLIFPYAFQEGREHGGFPRVRAHPARPGRGFCIGELEIMPIAIRHGGIEILAWRFESGGRSIVYATDCSAIPEPSWPLMQEPDVLVVDALRYREHVSHFCVEQALEAVQRLKPGRALFTHVAHDIDHESGNAALPDGVEFAYDTQQVQL